MNDEVVDLRENIRAQLFEPIVCDTDYCLISCEWFKKWQDYVGYNDTASEKSYLGASAAQPGAIDNSSLFEAQVRVDQLDNNHVLRLRRGLSSDIDYIILPTVSFDKLVSTFGIVHPRHRLVRKAIGAGQLNTEYRLEVYEPELTVTHLDETLLNAITSSDSIANPKVDDKYQFTRNYSIKTTVKSILEDARKFFNIDDNCEARLWSLGEDATNLSELPSWGSANWERVDENPDVTLEYVGVKQLHGLVVETRNSSEAKWPKEQYITALYNSRQSNSVSSTNPESNMDDVSVASASSSNLSRPASKITANASQAADGRSSPKLSNSNSASKTTSSVYKIQPSASNSSLPSTSADTLTSFGSTSKTGQNSTNSTPYEPGCCGLSNLGNTCFMNSALQCITHVGLLTEYFLKNRFEDQSVPLGRIATEFITVIRAIWSGQHPYYAPRSFKQAIGDFAPRFSGYAQQDSQELLAYLLDGLHEDLNLVRKKPYREEPDSISGRPDHQVAEESWSYYRMREQSVVVDLFHGQLKSTLVCPDCHVVSVKFDPFLYLSVPIPLISERPIELLFVPFDASTSRPSRKFARVRFMLDSTATMVTVYERACDALNHIDVLHLKVNNGSNSADFLNDSNNRVDDDFDQEPASMQLTADRVRLFKFDDKNVVHTALRYSKEETLDDDRWGDMSNLISVFELDPADSEAASRRDEKTKSCAYVPIYIKHDKESPSLEEYNSIPPLLRVDAELLNSSYDQLVLAIQRRIDRFFPIARAKERIAKDGDDQQDGDAPMTTMDDWIAANHTLFYSVTAFINLKSRTDLTSTFRPSEQPGKDDPPLPTTWFSAINASRAKREAEAVQDLHNDEAFRFLEEQVVLLVELSAAARKHSDFLDLRRSAYSSDSIYNDPSWSASNYSKRYGLSSSPVTLNDCLDLFTKREQLGKNDLWYCPRCREHKAATKKFDLWYLPPVLIIHLKRFYSTSAYYRHKNSTLVRAPLEGLDLSQYVVSPDEPRTVQRSKLSGPFTEEINGGEAVYDLVAVSDHGGGLYGGHYTASCRNYRSNAWFEFNDSHVSPIHDETSIVTEQAYLLVYQRRAVSNLINESNAPGNQQVSALGSACASGVSSTQSASASDATKPHGYNTRLQAAASKHSASSFSSSPLFRNTEPTAFEAAAFQTAGANGGSQNGGGAGSGSAQLQSHSAQSSRAASPKLSANVSSRVTPSGSSGKPQPSAHHSHAHSQSTSNLPTATGGSTPAASSNAFSSSPSSSSSTSVASSVSTIVDRSEFTARQTASSTQLGVGAANEAVAFTSTSSGQPERDADADDESESENGSNIAAAKRERHQVNTNSIGDEESSSKHFASMNPIGGTDEDAMNGTGSSNRVETENNVMEE